MTWCLVLAWGQVVVTATGFLVGGRGLRSRPLTRELRADGMPTILLEGVGFGFTDVLVQSARHRV